MTALVMVTCLALPAASCLADFAGMPASEQGSSNPPAPPPPPPPLPPPPPPPSRNVVLVVVTPEQSDTLRSFGDTRTFRAEARDAAGRPVSVTFSWSLDPTNVVTLDASGVRVTATGNGTATVRATAEGVSGTAGVVVWQRVEDVDLDPRSVELDMSESVVLVATAYDDRDQLVTRALQFDWDTNKDYAVALTPDPLHPARVTVTRTFPVNANVIATTEGRSGSASIR